MPKIVRAIASITARIGYGDGLAPQIMGGNGSIQIMAPAEAPKKMDAIIMKTIPMKTKRKPKRNSLNGVGHERGSGIYLANVGTSRLRRS